MKKNGRVFKNNSKYIRNSIRLINIIFHLFQTLKYMKFNLWCKFLIMISKTQMNKQPIKFYNKEDKILLI